MNVAVWFLWACRWNSGFVIRIVLWVLWMKKECHVWLSLFSYMNWLVCCAWISGAACLECLVIVINWLLVFYCRPEPEARHIHLIPRTTILGSWMIWVSNSGRGNSLSSFATCLDRIWGTPSFVFSVNRSSFLEVKRPGSDVDHSPTSSAEVKNEYICISAPPVCHHVVDRENFTLFLIIHSLYNVRHCFTDGCICH